MTRSRWDGVSCRRRGLIGLVAVGLGLCLLPSAAGAGILARRPSGLEAGLDFYRGRTVTFITPDAPGGGFDTWARILVPYLASYLHATINIENIAPAQGIPGMDATAAAPADGTTVGWLNTLNIVSHQITNTPGLNFNPERVAFIGSTAPNSSVWASLTTASCPWTSWSALVHDSSAAHPVTELDMTASTTDLFTRLANIAFGITPQIIAGYTNTSAEVQGFSRGDGCVVTLGLSSIGSLLQSGKAVGLALENPAPPGIAYASSVADLQSVAELLKHFPPKTKAERNAASALVAYSRLDGRIVFAPGATPPDRVDALRWAMQKAMENPDLQRAALAAGDNPGFVSGSAAKNLYIEGIALGKSIGPDLS